MKLKKFNVLLVLFLVFGLFGCNIKSNKTIDDVQNALNSYYDSEKLDLSCVLNINASGMELNTIVKMKIDTSGINPSVIIEFSSLGLENTVYFYNGYSCILMDGTYYIEAMEFDLNEETPIPTLDFDEMDYVLSSITNIDTIEYTIKLDGSQVQSIIEDTIDMPVEGMDIEMELKVIADKETNTLKQMIMKANLTQYEQTVTIDMTVTINAIGEDVIVDIPDNIVEKIEKYISDQNNTPEPEPQP